jgi:hypothetical protein
LTRTINAEADRPCQDLGTTGARSSLTREVGVFGPDPLDDVVAFFDEHGCAIVRGVYESSTLAALEGTLVSRSRIRHWSAGRRARLDAFVDVGPLRHALSDSTPQPIWSATRWIVPCRASRAIR